MNKKPNSQWSNEDFLRLRRLFKARGYEFIIDKPGPLYVLENGKAIRTFDLFAEAEEWILAIPPESVGN
jgi:hypothetical protein